MALQEKMKSLNTETHVWKHKANALRKEFDNILSKFSRPINVVAVEEDGEFCYGSTDLGKNNLEVQIMAISNLFDLIEQRVDFD